MGKGIGGHQRAYEGRTNVWLTPPDLLAALGEFDLDPCAVSEPRPWPTAKKHYVEEQDGLSLPWENKDRIFLNPPYGPHVGKWLDKLATHGNGIALIFARTETEAFHRYVWERASALFFFEGRLFFHRPDGQRAKHNGGAPSVLVAYDSLKEMDGPNERTLRLLEGYNGAFVSLRDREKQQFDVFDLD